MTDRTNALLAAALMYAAQGIPVLPIHTPVDGGCSCRDGAACDSPGKHPRTPHGKDDATTDAGVIRRWWTQWPTANIGLRTGGRLVVLDIDPRNGGAESLAALEAVHGPLPPTWEVESGSGEHRYLASTNGGVRSRTLAPGLDLLGEGKLVVAPPSLHASGRRYRQKPGNGRVAVIPEWLASLAARPSTAPDPAPDEPIPEGRRNFYLWRQACRMRRFGLGQAAILAALIQENQRCVPPYDEAQLISLAERAARYAPSATREHLTDLGNGRRLVADHGEDLRHVSLWGRWLVWDDSCWAPDETEEVARRAKETALGIYLEAAQEPDEYKRKALVAHARKTESRDRQAAMITLASSEPSIAVHPDDLDANSWLLNCQNGTLDLRTGQLRPHRRADLLTRRIPVAWDPFATCPRWERFLDRIFAGNTDTIQFVQRGVGYSLTGDTREQCIIIGHGGGANGKTTFGRALTDLLDGYAAWTPTETLLARRQDKIPNDVARLKGIRLVLAAEAEAGRRLAEALVKRFTGGDKLVARFLHQEFFEFDATFKIWLLVNHRPEIRGTDHAMWRRIRLLPFTVQIPPAEQDKTLPEQLRAEFPGILRWAVEGCLAWQQNGLGWADEVRQATAAYREEMDVLGQFLSECCRQGGDDFYVAAKDLYGAYKNWCKEVNEQTETQKWFGTRLKERGFRRERPHRVWTWFGLRLGATEAEEPGGVGAAEYEATRAEAR